jgi:hypothetical protein
VAYFKVLCQYSPGGTEKNHEKPQSVYPVVGVDLNPGPSKYEEVLLSTRPWRSIGG